MLKRYTIREIPQVVYVRRRKSSIGMNGIQKYIPNIVDRQRLIIELNTKILKYFIDVGK